VADGLGLKPMPKPAEPARPVRTDLPPSPKISIIGNTPPSFKGRKVGAMVSDGTDAVLLAALQIPLGFAIAAPWAIARRGLRLFQVLGAIGALIVVAGGIFARRLAVSATFAQYHGNFGGLPLGRSPLGRGILLSWIAVGLAYAWSARALRASRER